MSNEIEASSIGAKAFAIIADQIRTEVSSENAALEEGNSLLEPLAAHLGSVEIRVADANYRVIPLKGLEDASFQGVGALGGIRIPVSDVGGATSLPLAEYGPGGTVQLCVSKEVVARFPSSVNPQVRGVSDDGFLDVLIFDASGKIAFIGKVDKLSAEDFEAVKSEVGGVQNDCDHASDIIGRYLREGLGMNSPDASFTLELLFFLPNWGTKGKGIVANALLVQEYALKNLETKLHSLQGTLKKIDDLIATHDAVSEEDQIGEGNVEELELGVEGRELSRNQLEEVRREAKQTEGSIKECLELKKEQLNALEILIPGFNYAKSPDDELRKLVFVVDSNRENRGLLKCNHTLKLERQVLMNIQSRIGQIELFYDEGDGDDETGFNYGIADESGGSISVSLESGFLAGGEGHLWSIPLPPARIGPNKLHSLEVYMSGVSLSYISTENRHVNHVLRVEDQNDALSIAVMVIYSSRLFLLGRFKFDSLASRADTLANESFPGAIADLFNRRRSDLEFPNDCAFVPDSVLFHPDSIKDALKLVQMKIKPPTGEKSPKY